MKQLRFLLIVGFMSSVACVAQSDREAAIAPAAFLAWWDSTLWTRAHTEPPVGVERVDHVYGSLAAFTGTLDLSFMDESTDSTEVRVLFDSADDTWLLAVPWSRLETPEDLRNCVYKSWLISTAHDVVLELEFFPYCSETYGPAEKFTLYHLAPNTLPWIELGTNGPACVPVFLIQHDKAKRAFVVERDQCGG